MQGEPIINDHGGPVPPLRSTHVLLKSLKWLDRDHTSRRRLSRGTGRTSDTTSTHGWRSNGRDDAPRSESLRRFTRGAVAPPVVRGPDGALILTAAFLYVDPLSAMVGRRALLAEIHFWADFASDPARGRRGAVPAFRQDAPSAEPLPAVGLDVATTRARLDTSAPSGKFNAGQKVNSAFVLGPRS